MGITEDKFRCNTAVFSDSPEDWGDLLSTWGYLAHKLGADPTHNPMLYTVPTLAPTALKRKIYEVVFEQFGSPQTFVTPGKFSPYFSFFSSLKLTIPLFSPSFGSLLLRILHRFSRGYWCLLCPRFVHKSTQTNYQPTNIIYLFPLCSPFCHSRSCD